MTITMLTALVENGDKIVDLTELAGSERDRIHGSKNRRRNGIDTVCRHCHNGAHLCPCGSKEGGQP